MPVDEHAPRATWSMSTLRDLQLRTPGDVTAVSEATRLLVPSFLGQPHFVDLFPDRRVRTRALPQIFTALLADAHQHGRIDLVSSNRALAGAAVWYPPGAYPLSAGRHVRALPAMLRLAFAAPRSLRRVGQFQAAAARLHPSAPCWYLAAIGVDPAVQGTGTGSWLLRSGLTRADAAGQPCYLETHSLRKVEWYRAHGFEVRDAEVAFTPGGPSNWSMHRPGIQSGGLR